MKVISFCASAVVTVSLFLLVSLTGCKTVEFDDVELLGTGVKEEGIESLEEEERANLEALEEYAVSEELKTVDIEKSVVYVEQPVYYPEEEGEETVLKGKAAVAESLNQAMKSPQKFNGGLMRYDFN